MPIETVSSSDGSEGQEISTLGVLGNVDYNEEQPGYEDLINKTKNNSNLYHERMFTPNGNIPFDFQALEGNGSQNALCGQDEYLRKSTSGQKNTEASSFPSNIEGSFIGGARSSFGSSSRSNSSSLGTNGTNHSLSSRGSAADSQNIHPSYGVQASPNTSVFGDSLGRNVESESEAIAVPERGIPSTIGSGKSVGYGNEYFALNGLAGWNVEINGKDTSGQSGSLSSFSSSNGSSRSRPPSNKSNLSTDRK